jgi:CHAT domain-containing protein
LRDETPQAIQAWTRIDEIREHFLNLMLYSGSESQKILYMRTLTVETNNTISLHVHTAPSNPDAARLALTTILRRKGRVLDVMTDQIGALRRRSSPEDRSLLDSLSNARAQLASLVLEGGSKSDAQRPDEKRRLEAEVERLEAQVSARSAEFRLQSQPVSIERVQQAIPAGAALIEMYPYRPFNAKGKGTLEERFGAVHYVAYVLFREGEPTFVDLGEAAPIDKGVVRLRTALSNPKSTDVKETARALDQMVMLPVRKLLGATRRLFLSPEGELNLVPFSALVDENNRYLIESYSLTYLTSGRDLLRLQAHAQTRQQAVVFANPSFDLAITGGSQPEQAADNTRGRRSLDLSQVRFGQLEGTAGEGSALKSILPSAQLLTGAEATEIALKHVRGPSILHVASHGFFLPDELQQSAVAETRGLGLSSSGGERQTQPVRGENPLLRSGLALAGANKRQSGDGEDGILTALEASGLDLWGTKLVVLSACDTGVGEVKNGDGVYGLRRALLLAGSESQVMSLWQVSDAATRDLMVAYYKRLQSGEGRAEALRAVQLEMLGSNVQSQTGPSRGIGLESSGAKKDRSHPFFWASFIQLGDWRSLDGKDPGER